jgi:arylsulfatase A-like enzyme
MATVNYVCGIDNLKLLNQTGGGNMSKQIKRRVVLKTMGLSAAAMAIPQGLFAPAATVRQHGEQEIPADRPNIIFIMTDDHASHAMSCYGSRINKTPNLDRIAEEGMRFDNCFCTNSICAPSRAVILTGKYSHLNGVIDNRKTFDGSQQTFPKLLKKAGYRTAMIGKWHLKSDPTGFDYWNILPGQGAYYNPELIEMGERKQYEGYVTDIITDLCLSWLKNRKSDIPFCLMFHHKAPHRNWQPDPGHLTMYDGVEIPEPETLFDNYSTRSDAAREQEMTIANHMYSAYDLKVTPPSEDDTQDKSMWGSTFGRLSEEQQRQWNKAYGPRNEAFRKAGLKDKDLVRWKYQRYIKDYLRCIASVDDNIGRLLDYLDASKLAENTVVVYTSDQGFYLGDHGWFDKRFMYEESLRMPLLVRYPKEVKPGSLNDDIVLNLDFAPTFLDFAAITRPADMQGRSFRRLLQGKTPDDWRTSMYYHYYEYPAVHMVKRHYGVRTRRYKLIHFYYDIDAWELYDLQKDPDELNNVYDDPSYAGIITQLKAELKRLRNFYGDTDELTGKFLQEDLNRNRKRR